MSEQTIHDLSRPNLDSNHPPNDIFPSLASSILDAQLLSPEDLMKPFIIDTYTKTLHADPHFFESEKLDERSTDYSQVSPDGSRFCVLSSDSQNSFYFGQRIQEKLEVLPTVSDIQSIKEKLMDIYLHVNQKEAIKTTGVFGIVFTTPPDLDNPILGKKTIMAAVNCGGSVYLHNSARKEPQDITDTSHPNSLGKEGSPNYLNITITMPRAGDIILATPNKIDKIAQKEIVSNLSQSEGKSSFRIARAAASSVRSSTIRETGVVADATALVVSTRVSSNYLDENTLTQEVITHPLNLFDSAKSVDELLTFVKLNGKIPGIGKAYEYQNIVESMLRGKLDSIPRAGGLRNAVERLINEDNALKSSTQNQSPLFPNEII